MILDSFNAVVFKVCPIIAAGVVVGSIYWVAVSYGAITVMQVNILSNEKKIIMQNLIFNLIFIFFFPPPKIMGQENGLDLMENADPLMLLVGLPIIPVALILSKLINWEDTALTFLRRNARKVPVLKYILPFLT